jgi:hypothetical protein
VKGTDFEAMLAHGYWIAHLRGRFKSGDKIVKKVSSPSELLFDNAHYA